MQTLQLDTSFWQVKRESTTTAQFAFGYEGASKRASDPLGHGKA